MLHTLLFDAKYDVCWPFFIKYFIIPMAKSSKLLSPAFGDSEIKRKCQLSPKQGRFYCPSNQAVRVGCSMKLGTKISISAFCFLLLASLVVSSWRIGFYVRQK